eukprot:15126770-Alexandrium_andersonii.AAC.1
MSRRATPKATLAAAATSSRGNPSVMGSEEIEDSSSADEAYQFEDGLTSMEVELYDHSQETTEGALATAMRAVTAARAAADRAA